MCVYLNSTPEEFLSCFKNTRREKIVYLNGNMMNASYTHWKCLKNINVILIIKVKKKRFFFSFVRSLLFLNGIFVSRFFFSSYKIQHLISIRNVCHNSRIYCQNNVYKNHIYGDKKNAVILNYGFLNEIGFLSRCIS